MKAVKPVRLRRAGLGLGLALGLLSSALAVRAADLGTLGPTYEITEPHLLRFI